ncbi:hypothetical protein [Haloarchaeobius sp. HRN-SO-5]|uniref:hypothetical protein n=1 Tax=Haloarchaeobius sp. HRN-SO-5 TaxID=3446118 RepID=UPI003EB9E6AA
MAWPHPITVLGFGSGILAALVMGTIYDEYFSDESLPTTVFLQRMLNANQPSAHEISGVLLYLGYGGFMGALYPWTFRGVLGLSPMWINDNPYTLPTGLVFGLLLLGPWAILRVLGLVDHPKQMGGVLAEDSRREYLVVIGLHVVYGLFLGFVIGLSVDIWYPIIGLR